MRAPLLLLVTLAIGCESAAHRDLSKRIGDRRGTHVVSAELAAPPGAAWTSARVQTMAYRSESKADAFQKRWSVWTDLLVTYPADAFASTRLVTLGEGEAPADALVEQARRTYELRAAGPDQLELSVDGAAWTPIPVPRPAH